MTTKPKEAVEEWEILAAKVALEAHKKTKNYSQFSETIYQGIKEANQTAREEERERIGKYILDQLDNTPKIKALKSISLAFRDMVIKAITKK